jgi:hypothetical protein
VRAKNLKELYDQTPVARHPEIVVSRERVFFNDEEYVIVGGGELRLVRSQKRLEERIDQIVLSLNFT